MSYLLLILSGGIGSLFRYILSKETGSHMPVNFPFGTLSVNLIGCFIAGILYGIFENYVISPNMRLIIFVGFLGGFTTFASFGIETVNLIRQNEIWRSILNIIINNAGGIVLVYFGIIISKYIFK